MNKFKKIVILIIVFTAAVTCTLGTVIGIGLSMVEEETTIERSDFSNSSEVPSEIFISQVNTSIYDELGRDMEELGFSTEVSFNRDKNIYFITFGMKGMYNEFVLSSNDERKEFEESVSEGCLYVKKVFENEGYQDTDVCIVLTDDRIEYKSSGNDIIYMNLNGETYYDVFKDGGINDLVEGEI